MNAADWRGFFEMTHRVLVIFDDWICDRFNFSRKPKGRKYESDQQLTGGKSSHILGVLEEARESPPKTD